MASDDYSVDVEPIYVKGRRPRYKYAYGLKEAFQSHSKSCYSRREADAALGQYRNIVPNVSCALLSELFPPKMMDYPRRYPHLPISMGDAPPEKLQFNLEYQSTRLKLAIEDKLRIDAARSLDDDSRALSEVLAILLCTEAVADEPIWRRFNDNDFDALTFRLLQHYDPNRINRLLAAGFEANRLALLGLEQSGYPKIPLEKLIAYSVFAGVVWWLAPEYEPKPPSLGVFGVDDRDQFTKDLSTLHGTLVCLLDDNGELVWDLALIQSLLTQNSELKVTVVINPNIVTNNTSMATMERCFEHPLLAPLVTHTRFEVFKENHYRSAIDPSYCSDALIEKMESADCLYIKGASYFETIQGIGTDTYYAFVVHSKDSILCTGLPKGRGVFAYSSANMIGYHYLKETLVDTRHKGERHQYNVQEEKT